MRRREVKWLEMLTQWDAYMLRNYRKVIIIIIIIIVTINMVITKVIRTINQLYDDRYGSVVEKESLRV